MRTVCIGMAASMGAFLLMAGKKGKRLALPNSEIMIHQPLGGAQGQATDVAIRAEWLMKTKEKMTRMMSEMTGQDMERVKQRRGARLFHERRGSPPVRHHRRDLPAEKRPVNGLSTALKATKRGDNIAG